MFEGKVAITAHKATNALVITSSLHDYAALRRVIDMLDSERRQVFIEAVIMELSVDRSNSFGLVVPRRHPERADRRLGLGARLPRAATRSAACSGMRRQRRGARPASRVGVQGPAIANSQQLVGLSLPGFGVAINALAASGDANILSTPHLIATDNVEAEISVGQNVPLQTSSGRRRLGSLGGARRARRPGQAGARRPRASRGLGGLGGLGGFGGAVPRQDVGTTIKITPHINDSDEIRLEIAQEISSAGAPSEAGDLGVVSIDRTRAKTELVVRDQQTVVIGGLMRDQITRADTKVPVLGDIPLLGALFRSTQQAQDQEEPAPVPHAVHHPLARRSALDLRAQDAGAAGVPRPLLRVQRPRLRAADGLLAHARPGRRDRCSSSTLLDEQTQLLDGGRDAARARRTTPRAAGRPGAAKARSTRRATRRSSPRAAPRRRRRPPPPRARGRPAADRAAAAAPVPAPAPAPQPQEVE